jgi:hypothetical protein
VDFGRPEYRAIEATIYSRDYLLQDLRLLNEAALALLWRLDPEAAILSTDEAAKYLHSEAHRGASEFMRTLRLIRDYVETIEPAAQRGSRVILKARMDKTGYPTRYVEDDLFALHRGLTELSYRVHRPECRLIGSNRGNRSLRWLAEALIARGEAILDIVDRTPHVPVRQSLAER